VPGRPGQHDGGRFAIQLIHVRDAVGQPPRPGAEVAYFVSGRDEEVAGVDE
jgi:hypothetical protein